MESAMEDEVTVFVYRNLEEGTMVQEAVDLELWAGPVGA
jgi:hypothetical protein